MKEELQLKMNLKRLTKQIIREQAKKQVTNIDVRKDELKILET